jgi:hypothetical protein
MSGSGGSAAAMASAISAAEALRSCPRGGAHVNGANVEGEGASSEHGALQPRSLSPQGRGGAVSANAALDGFDQIAEFQTTKDLRMNAGSGVTVSACGRTLHIDRQCASTMQQMLLAVQRELSMHGQDFELLDVHGTRLESDSLLREAVAEGRTPIVAALHEASIHYIENRREELSQMQWKLIRDQLSGLGDKVVQLGRRVHELTESFSDQREKQYATNERLQSEFPATLESAKEFTRHTQAQLGERMDALLHLIHTERNVREASKHGLESQMQAIRDLLEGDKSTRRVEINTAQSTIEDMKKVIAEEQRLREETELRHNQGMYRINDRIDTLSRVHADTAQDHAEQIKQVELRRINELHDPTKHIIKVSQKAETSELEVKARCQQMEDKTASLENRLQEFMHRQSLHIEDLRSHKEKISQGLEQVRSEERGRGLAMRNVIGRMGDLEERRAKDGEDQHMQQEDGAMTQSQVLATSGPWCPEPIARGDDVLLREEVSRIDSVARSISPPRIPFGRRSNSPTPSHSLVAPPGMVRVHTPVAQLSPGGSVCMLVAGGAPLPGSASMRSSSPSATVLSGIPSPGVPLQVRVSGGCRGSPQLLTGATRAGVPSTLPRK